MTNIITYVIQTLTKEGEESFISLFSDSSVVALPLNDVVRVTQSDSEESWRKDKTYSIKDSSLHCVALWMTLKSIKAQINLWWVKTNRFTNIPIYWFTDLPISWYTALPIFSFTIEPSNSWTSEPFYRFTVLPANHWTAEPVNRFTNIPIHRFSFNFELKTFN